MSKQNEITAFKACGVSLFRLAVPVLMGSVLFSGGLFAFDFYYVAGANRKQDALRDEIKGRATQTYLRPDRKWIMGYNASRIFNYKYFDNSGRREFDERGQRLRTGAQDLPADAPDLCAKGALERTAEDLGFREWLDMRIHGRLLNAQGYAPFQAKTFPNLTEPPDYFLIEALQDKQMNFLQLERYIQELTRSGFEGTVKLRVRLFRKFSVPLFALMMAMIAVPFGFLVGNRGAMAGMGMSIGIAVGYLGVGQLFEKLGDAGQLQPVMAAWGPDVVFALAGAYLMLRMRS